MYSLMISIANHEMKFSKYFLFFWLGTLFVFVSCQESYPETNNSPRGWANEIGNWPSSSVYGKSESSSIIRETTYFIVASRTVRPGQIYRVAVTVLETRFPLTVRASVHCNGVEISSESNRVKTGITEVLIMRVPPTSVVGDYKLRVEGLYNNINGGSAFVNETKLIFSQRSMTIFIQTDKPVYMQGQTVRFRAIPVNLELKPFDSTIDVYMLDPNRHIMRRWLSRQSNLGTVSLDYQLSDQPRYGFWTIQVIAQGQIEEYSFSVEEYYQTRFEVNVTMPEFIFSSEKYLRGFVMANYTSGAPVRGNLTLKASIKPINEYRYNRQLENIPRSDIYLDFDESFPFWFPSSSKYYSSDRNIPHMKYFYGVYEFAFPLAKLQSIVPSLDDMEVKITAIVGDRFLNEVVEGYSSARLYNSSVRVSFLGGSPQVFKPAMPFSAFIAVSYHDGSPLSEKSLKHGRLDIVADVGMKSRGHRTLDLDENTVSMLPGYKGIWEVKIDLRSELGLGDDKPANEMLNDIESLKLMAYFKDPKGERAQTELLMLSHYSPSNHHIKVTTSTKDARVGEYVIFHVKTNFYMESFEYLILSKGIILLSGRETGKNSITTFAVALSAEMAPTATIIVYNVGTYGDVVADSLSFPVNGISRNEFTLLINNNKARTGERVEVAIYGEPGSYVAIAATDVASFGMQAGNDMTYEKVTSKMAVFDENDQNTHSFTWHSHEGDPDHTVYFPSSTFGIDANQTFEYAGLVVFTDAELKRYGGNGCNKSQNLGDCLNGKCYKLDRRCDGVWDCEDGTDEARCPFQNKTEINNFRLMRFSRTQRQYENVWLWHDINIGPHGRYIFEVDVPERPTHWMVSAFGMSSKNGFGMLYQPQEYVGVLPFFINVEMPTVSHQGEQVGVRVTVFNYMTNDIEAVVVLEDSSKYKFVHVEQNGIVSSYNPKTSFGEHQFFVFIKAQDVAVVYLPIVPVTLGEIPVTVTASTLIGKDSITRNLYVLPDGLPQYRHESILLDLKNKAYVLQYMHVNVTDTPIIPYDEDRYYVFGSNKAFISVVGDVVGPIFPTMPVNATSLLNLPMDGAEHTIFSFAANMYTTMYMRLISQRNHTQEKQSFYHMNIGYQRILSFMLDDGSFTLFRSDWNHSSPSVWLTAYCARVLHEATFYEWENYIYIDPRVITKAVEWVLKHQATDGSFYEVTWLPDRKMNSSLTWENDTSRFKNIPLTAHILITLEAVKDLTGGLGSQIAQAQGLALSWLERNWKIIDTRADPYEVAIVAYALMICKHPSLEGAFSSLLRHARSEGGYMYWGKEQIPPPPYKLENQRQFLLPRLPYKYDASNIETTALALLVYNVKQEQMTEPIVKWLNSQRLTDGGWASTQDTAWAMKALIEYTNRNRLRDVSNLTVTIEATALGQYNEFHVTDQNIAKLQRIEIPHAWGTVRVQGKGAGYAILQMSVQYNVDIPKFQTQPPLEAFSLTTKANFYGRNQSHIDYYCCQRWTNKNESIRSGMAVLDVTIPTGYIIQQQTLDAYVRNQNIKNLMYARFQQQKVLFYFDFLDLDGTCVNFTVERWYPVANMSRYLPIRVYDYYAPERFNETIFDATPTYVLNICEVCGSSQCPYCPIYNLGFMIKPLHSLMAALVFVVLYISRTRVYFPNYKGIS